MNSIALWCCLVGIALGMSVRAATTVADPVQEVIQFEQHLQDVYNSEEFAKHPEIAFPYWEGGDQVQWFDLLQPGVFIGPAFRKHFVEIGYQFIGRVEFLDMKVHANDGIAFFSCKQHFVGKDKQGRPMDTIMLATDGLVKTDDKWRIAHEQVSMPMDYKTLVTLIDPKE